MKDRSDLVFDVGCVDCPCCIDHMLFGRAVVRGGRRVPPEEWGSAFESGHRQRGAEVGSIGARYVDPELRPYLDALRWPDPLSFIGRAANEGA